MGTFIKGYLKYWNKDRAYGFITVVDEFGIRRDYFIHVVNIMSGTKPVVGCEAQFIAGMSPKGATALQVTFLTMQEPAVSEPQDAASVAAKQMLDHKYRQEASSGGEDVLAGGR
jgi:cold shock CspA family protein